ncbi:protein suppressor of gene silencing [Datura stramonium]|uniref:Protein suppressor of gene silencing n=1 Tax=Datura stramonium TaxID=4076 RepID=A0ABS8RGY9_DATST|nr:protein suppressor of gene silencing [Datura stramonium]
MSSNNRDAWKFSNSSGKQKAISKTSTIDEINVESWGNKKSTWGRPNIIQKLGFYNNDGSFNSPVTDDDVNVCELDELDFPDDENDVDEFQSDDNYDDHSNVKEMSCEVLKKNRWFKKIFECLDSLTVTKINDSVQQWHCLAYKGGPGEVMWFTGLHSLLSHTKTKGGSRTKLHRELAQLLEEELRQSGTSVVPLG